MPAQCVRLCGGGGERTFVRQYCNIDHYLVLYRERDEKIYQLTEAQKQQAQQAERALEDFKNQVEKNSARMFDEMKSQVGS